MMAASVLDAALQLAASGLPVFPCRLDPDNPKRNKKPTTLNGFKDASNDPARIAELWRLYPGALIGVPTGPASGFDGLDFDYRHGAAAWENANAERLPETRIHQTPSGGRHLLFRSDPRVRNSQGQIAPGVDVRGDGGYVVFPPSKGYSVIHDVELAPWPSFLLEPGLALPKPKPERPISSTPYTPTSNARLEGYLRKVLEAVSSAAEGQKHERLRNAALTLGGRQQEFGFSDAEAIGWLMKALPTTVVDWKGAEKTAEWGLAEGRGNPLPPLEDRYTNGHDTTSEASEEMPPPINDPGYDDDAAANPTASPTDNLNGYDLTEDGIALAFTAEHKDLLRYDHTRGTWFQWTGTAWQEDETKLAFSWSRRTCRRLAREAGAKDKQLVTLAKAATAAAVERFAQSDPAFAVTSIIWDNDPFLLGTPGGTMDLKTAELRAPVPEDHITKLTAVSPSVMPDCPRWLEFLEQVTANDQDLIRFLKQWCGYCLTGDTREHALLFAHGPGGNGKGVFLNTVAGVMGGYARNAAMDSFTASAGDKHPTDLAMLCGSRLVTASETEEGRAWAEARIKALTGGDRITARFMRQDFFEYQPQFKLTIIGNHKPVLRNVDEAARRRFNMIPFLYKPPKNDMQLEVKLRNEWPGILRWMIEGCIDWQTNGLIRPEVVTKATAEYFSEQDTVHQWVEDSCELGQRKFDTLAVLFKNWTDYALANGEKPGTTKWFSQTLARLGCEAVKHTPGFNGKRGFKGISVKLPEVNSRYGD